MKSLSSIERRLAALPVPPIDCPYCMAREALTETDLDKRKEMTPEANSRPGLSRLEILRYSAFTRF